MGASRSREADESPAPAAQLQRMGLQRGEGVAGQIVSGRFTEQQQRVIDRRLQHRYPQQRRRRRGIADQASTGGVRQQLALAAPMVHRMIKALHEKHAEHEGRPHQPTLDQVTGEQGVQ